jgi:hypothetical protein
MHEHAFVTYADALLFLYELHDRGDPRFQTAAARWHATFTLAAKLPLNEADGVMRLLSGIGGANRLVVRRRLLDRVEREGPDRAGHARAGHGQAGHLARRGPAGPPWQRRARGQGDPAL